MDNFKTMEGGESYVEKREKSLGFSLGDERIKLIDILSEDEEFLVASPFCDPLQDCFQEIKEGSGFQHNEQNILSRDIVEPCRPSFLRRSLAWDSAFLNNAGVLVLDELSFINKGLGKTENTLPPGTLGGRKRRSDVEVDWFEIELFENEKHETYKLKPGKVFDMARVSLEPEPRKQGLFASLKKVDESVTSKKNSNQTSIRTNIYIQSQEKIKKETTARGGRHAILSPKSPKAQYRSVNIPTRSNRKDLPGKFNVKRENTSSGKIWNEEKKSVNSFSLPSLDVSSDTLKRKTEGRKTNLLASVETVR